ncbi:MAG: biosynthetic-type acetolactate synthase large subunit [Treponema porcinum]|uniref:Acetolactate synthase n=1 Tax=Treponema porcinum TaxID=261392 RepID=A0A1T4JPX0_TREPO|nr:biosynthetic-type acetolactate synthase large subunit [Treponema porcinum]MCI6179126.1 biosynthetic-type acetolactate synthase large subunit [Treponema porcinum]MCI6322789.1 biosynthetic-type acetolactate synthase large subunit [Treponema porcinum]MCI6481885.1 biosynthetic-type acetolactate synthase large subunit [Treponema porcinum]MCI6721914.1 biosynthetic-type acetolactate synthase large subunit [Treponema porcinum]MCI6815885.1 biosynthetic-type acetolactate synthase large subunit [Trepo
MKITGSQIVIECLVEQGVDTVFGYPGGAILNIYDELYKNENRIRHILTAHEQGASHAADGYARATGKVGVCMATSGPGATNLVTGIATAYMDSVPLVAITCNVGKSLLGKDSFQEIDITGVTMPITKHNFIVMDVKDLAQTIREAFAIARSGRPGPVLIDIPKDVTAAVTEFEPLKNPSDVDMLISRHKNIKRAVTLSEPDEGQLKMAAELINGAKRPVIYAGGGVKISGAEKELLAFAEKADIPVSESLMARDCFPSLHPLCTWMVGMHGTKASNMAITESDLVIAIGARFSDRVYGDSSKFAQHAKVLHIDIDPAEINKNISTDGCVVGDVKQVLAALLPMINAVKHDEWISQVQEWKKEYPSCYDKNPKDSINPKFICECINRIAGEDTFITTEVGQHQMWTAQFYPFSKPRTFITSGGLGTMGYGTGAAIGIQLAKPERRVVHIAGDGSFRMNCNELATISHYNLPIVIVVENNNALGNVRMWQRLFYGKRFSQTTLDFGPDWVKLADAYGIKGYRATNAKEFEKVFAEAFKSGKAAIIDARVDKDEMVLPMVPGGKPIYNMIMELSKEMMD